MGRARVCPAGLTRATDRSRGFGAVAPTISRCPSCRSSCRSTSAWPSPSSCPPSCSRSRCAPAAPWESRNRLVRSLLRLEGRGGALIAGGVALTGILLVAGLGLQVAEQPWLILALAIYALDLALAFFIQRPELRTLVGVRAAWDDRAWQAQARRLRYVSYAMAGLIGLIAFLMSTKPQL